MKLVFCPLSILMFTIFCSFFHFFSSEDAQFVSNFVGDCVSFFLYGKKMYAYLSFFYTLSLPFFVSVQALYNSKLLNVTRKEPNCYILDFCHRRSITKDKECKQNCPSCALGKTICVWFWTETHIISVDRLLFPIAIYLCNIYIWMS